jgi:PAS domain S-box-containing protein
LEVNSAFYTTALYDGPVLGRLATDLYQLPVEFITSFWREHKERHTAKFTDMISPVNGRSILVATSPFIDDRFVTSFFDITERKLNEAIFKDIVEKNPISIQILDMDGYPIQVNSAHTNLFGVKPPADYSVLKDPQLLSLGFDELFGRIKKGEVVYLPDTFYNVHDVGPSFPDSPVWVKAVGFTLNSNNGKPEKIVLMHENITEKKIAEKELIKAKVKAEESEGKYRLLFENANEAIYIVQNEKLVFTNPACEQLTGISKDNLIGISISDFVDENDKEHLLKHHYDLINGITQNQNSIFTIINQEGLKKHLSINSVLINWNGLPATLNFGTDITDRKKAEEELMAQRQIYEQILEQSLAGYWDWDIPTGYEYLSPTFKKMFGYEDDEIENRAESWQKLIFSEDLPFVYEEFDKHIESKGKIPYYNEVRYHHKNGSIIWVICTGKVTEWDDNGKPMRMIGCHIDITARKHIEQELNRAKEKAQESDRLKSAFLANMSHEIRTPMNGILGFAEILKDPDLTGDQQQEYIKIIEKSGNRMLNIINDIVDISKIEAGLMKVNLTESNINEQIEYIYTFFKPEVEAKGMKLLFNTTLSAQEATILTDREKVYAIFTNLVKNAIKYSREGSIEIGYKIVETLHATSLQFYVKDTGIGIRLNRQEAIFERFIQADITDKMARQGAGLGLAITKSHVEMLGGKIWVESREGEGSTFYFTLPYNHKPEVGTFAQSSVSGIQKYNWPKKLKILIAEDDPTSEMLRNCQYITCSIIELFSYLCRKRQWILMTLLRLG